MGNVIVVPGFLSQSACCINLNGVALASMFSLYTWMKWLYYCGNVNGSLPSVDNEWMVFQATILFCKAILHSGQTNWANEKKFDMDHAQVPDHLLDLLTCSPVRYHCAVAVPHPQSVDGIIE